MNTNQPNPADREYEAEKRDAAKFRPIRSSDWFKIPFNSVELDDFLENVPPERRKKDNDRKE